MRGEGKVRIAVHCVLFITSSSSSAAAAAAAAADTFLKMTDNCFAQQLLLFRSRCVRPSASRSCEMEGREGEEWRRH